MDKLRSLDRHAISPRRENGDLATAGKGQLHVPSPPGRGRNRVSIHDDAPSCDQAFQPREDGFS